MRVRPEQLPAHLARGLEPIYFVYGEEPLQAVEAVDVVRREARARGYSERVVLHADAGFDWGAFQAETETLSLFSSRRLIELRIGSPKAGDEGAAALARYAARPAPDIVLLVSAGALDWKAVKKPWVTGLAAAAAVVEAQEVPAARLAEWVRQRAQQRGLALSADAAELLAQRTEGNLLACAQEVDRLLLLHGGGRVDVTAAAASAADSARFDIYQLADRALAGDKARALRALRGLRQEGFEVLLVLWALARDLRVLVRVAAARARGLEPDRIFGESRVLSARRPLLRQASQRLGGARSLRLLLELAMVDRLAKGTARGDPWEALERIVLSVAGAADLSGPDPGGARMHP